MRCLKAQEFPPVSTAPNLTMPKARSKDMDDNVPPSHHRSAQARTHYGHDDPVVDAALDWFGKLRDTYADPLLLTQFRHWLAQDPRHETEFRLLENIWGSTAFLKATRSLQVPDVQERGRARRWTMRAVAVAAMIVLIVGISQYPRLMLTWRADYLTAIGDQSTIRLPDGSMMVLNTDSAVTVDFADGRREIALLRGEAWFDVRHDPAHPFGVTGGFGRTVAKGTSFSVRRQDDRDETVLEQGRVDVTCLCAKADRIELQPGESVAVAKDGPLLPAKIDPERFLAWREGRMVFEDVPLGQVVSELSRYYGGTVIVASDRINRLVVTGNYRLDSIEGAIRTLADAAGVKMTRVPGGLIILR